MGYTQPLPISGSSGYWPGPPGSSAMVMGFSAYSLQSPLTAWCTLTLWWNKFAEHAQKISRERSEWGCVVGVFFNYCKSRTHTHAQVHREVSTHSHVDARGSRLTWFNSRYAVCAGLSWLNFAPGCDFVICPLALSRDHRRVIKSEVTPT